MSEQTPSQAEGDRPEPGPHETPDQRDTPRTTPSQAEGEDTGNEDAATTGRDATHDEK